MGEGSRCFIIADPMQTDLKNESMQGGFEKMHKTFSGEDSMARGIYSFTFTDEDIMRSELVKFIIKKMLEI